MSPGVETDRDCAAMYGDVWIEALFPGVLPLPLWLLLLACEAAATAAAVA